MKLIIGGAYQGKLDYALEQDAPGASVYRGVETEPDIDFSARIINDLHRTLLAQLRAGIDPLVYMEENLDRLSSKIVICDDISCGIVPMEKELRLWRETVGRVLFFLSENADEVVRVFCGLPLKIK